MWRHSIQFGTDFQIINHVRLFPCEVWDLDERYSMGPLTVIFKSCCIFFRIRLKSLMFLIRHKIKSTNTLKSSIKIYEKKYEIFFRMFIWLRFVVVYLYFYRSGVFLPRHTIFDRKKKIGTHYQCQHFILKKEKEKAHENKEIRLPYRDAGHPRGNAVCSFFCTGEWDVFTMSISVAVEKHWFLLHTSWRGGEKKK